ncbi:choline ABC transporter substrate-binding protein [Neptunomonas antarctica]|uniref:Glycine betaine/proline transport system substrate-binding protein n=1 Tax=Neptunomonas antarctica TaxID=619304 RepID=A0A1N7IXV0_9GAMM|nr:choline ABC transporter substrate-binding protein [Neptunomonas antarctica]SIS41827.1 glycine betaine/proline transport system substrate-binding protein [Neptunomonas antarctica]
MLLSYKISRLSTAIGLATCLLAGNAVAAEPAQCNTVHFTDPGWSDISSTNALASTVLQGLGYSTEISILGVPIGFEGMKGKEIDVFLGNWMPAQQKFIDKYAAADAIDVVGENLTGAKFTLAVPRYAYDAGVKDFSDLAEFGDKFRQRIYGIEAGSPANQLLQKMIDSGDFDLAKWRLVESGEQGVMSQVKREIKRQQFIVFLGWEPHPMNSNFDMAYLTGGDKYFGADFGGATIQTVTRKGYREECGNVGKLLTNLKFTLAMENQMMGFIIDDEQSPAEAAQKYLKANPEVLDSWLAGVTTIDGDNGLSAVQKHLGL